MNIECLLCNPPREMDLELWGSHLETERVVFLDLGMPVRDCVAWEVQLLIDKP